MPTLLRLAFNLVLITVGTLFAAFWVTILLVPLWRWIEAEHGIEAIGHSGPAEWCFLLVFGILMVPALYLLWRVSRRPPAA